MFKLMTKKIINNFTLKPSAHLDICHFHLAGSGDKDTTKEQETDKSNEESLSAIQNVEKTEEVIAQEVTIDTNDSKGDTITSYNETKEVKDETVIQAQEQEMADSKVVDGANADVSDTISESKKPIDPRTGEEDDDPELTRYQTFT